MAGYADFRVIDRRIFPAEYRRGEGIPPPRNPQDENPNQYLGRPEQEIIVTMEVSSENELFLLKFASTLHFWSRGEQRATRIDTMCPKCKTHLGVRAIVRDGKEFEQPPSENDIVFVVEIVGLSRDSLLPRRVGMTKFWSPPMTISDTLFTQCPVQNCRHRILIRVTIRPRTIVDANDDEGIEDDPHDRFGHM